MTSESAAREPNRRSGLSLPLLWLVARSARRELATRRRHRLALGLAAGLVVLEWLGRSGFGDAEGTLRNVAWLAALSVSGSFGGSMPNSDHDRLFRLRGWSTGVRERVLPLVRAALAFTVHGGASLLLGLSWLPLAENVSHAARIVGATFLLCVASLVGSLALGILASLSEAVLEGAAVVIFFALLLVPAALHAALPELPNPIDAWAKLIALSLRTLPT